MKLLRLNPIDIANYIVWRHRDEDHFLTHLKLQKIMYYVVAKYLKDKDKLLFEDPIYKWQYGPVIKPVYHQFKLFGKSKIKEPVSYLSSDSNYSGKGDFTINFVDPEEICATLDSDNEFKNVVLHVLKEFQYSTAFDLVERTHEESAWKNFESQILNGIELTYSKDELKSANI